VESDDVEETGCSGVEQQGKLYVCTCSGEDQVTGPNLHILMLCHDSCLPGRGKSRQTRSNCIASTDNRYQNGGMPLASSHHHAFMALRFRKCLLQVAITRRA
jgi:hypothetical protein